MMAGPPYDTGWAWACVLGSHFANMFLIGGFKSLGVLVVELELAFDASLTSVAIMLGLIGGGMSILSPIGAALGDRYSNRVVVIVGGILMALGSFSTSFAVNMTMVTISFGLLTGFGYGLVFGPANVVIGQYFRKRRSLANGIAVAGGSIGQLLIPLLLHNLIALYGWRGALLIYSAVILHVVVGAMLFRPLSFYSKKPQSDQQKHPLQINGLQGHGTALNENVIAIESTEKRNNASKATLTAIDSEELSLMIEDINVNNSAVVNKPINRKLTRISAKCDANGMEKKDSPPVVIQHNYYSKPQYTSTGSLCIYPLDVSVDQACMEQEALDDKTVVTVDQQRSSVLDMFKISFCPCLLKKGTFNEKDSMFDWSMFRNRMFLLYLVSTMFGNTGSINLYMFIPKHAEDLGFSRQDGAILISIGGVCDLVSRVAGGWFGDLGYVKRSNIMAVTILCLSVVTFVFTNLTSYGALVAYVIFVGTLGGMYAALFLVVLIDLVGIARTPKAFGLVLMVIGFLNVPMPVFLGYLRDKTGNCIASFSVCAGFMVICSIGLLLEPLVRRFEDKSTGKPEG